MNSISINHKFNNIDQIQLFNESVGNHFFDEAALKFFNGIVYPTIFRGRIFITSEKYRNQPRLYTIRSIRSDGSIQTICDFQGFSSKAQAERFITKNLKFEHIKIIDVLVKAFNTGNYIGLLKRLKANFSKEWNDVSELELVSEWLIEWVEKKLKEVE